MICGGSQTCGCSFQSASLNVSRDAGGLVTLETFGPGVVTSSTRPSSPFLWQHIFETDTGISHVWNGSAWVIQSFTIRPECGLSRVALGISNAITTIIDYLTEEYDPFAWHSSGTPSRITPTIPGVYQMWCGGLWQGDVDYQRIQNAALKNGASLSPQHTDDEYVGISATPGIWTMFDGISMNGTTDYLEHRVIHNNTSGNANTITPRCVVRWMRNL